MEISSTLERCWQEVVHELRNVLEMPFFRFFHRPIKSEFYIFTKSSSENDLLSFRSCSITSQHCNSVVVEKQIMVYESMKPYPPLGLLQFTSVLGPNKYGKTSVKEEKKNTVGCSSTLWPQSVKLGVMLGRERFEGWWDTFMASGWGHWLLDSSCLIFYVSQVPIEK